MNKLLLIAACLTLSAAGAFASTSHGATAYFVTVKAPPQATVKNFVNRKFKVTVTCTKVCKASTEALIKAGVARRLGFANVTGKLVVIGTSKATLTARTPTKMTLVPTSEAKKHLKGPVRVFGSAKGVPPKTPLVNYSVGWSTSLT